jgi:hypothetical protein
VFKGHFLSPRANPVPFHRCSLVDRPTRRLVVATYGASYSYFLIRILYGRRWSDHTDAAAVLSLYCGYVLVMAINGTTEAYVHSVSGSLASVGWRV